MTAMRKNTLQTALSGVKRAEKNRKRIVRKAKRKFSAAGM
jgi:hypothetical protein